MKRLLLDTNIYGEFILDRDFLKLKEEIQNKFVIHGFKIIRNELRDVPKEIKLERKNLRISLLHIYDELVKKDYQIDVVVSEDNKSMLTENALKAYRIINALEKKKTPNFIGYLEFKRWLI